MHPPAIVGRVATLSHVTGLPSTCRRLHVHDSAFIELIVRGRYAQSIRRDTTIRRSGDAYLMHRGVVHLDAFDQRCDSLAIDFVRDEEHELLARHGGPCTTLAPLVLGQGVIPSVLRETQAPDDLSALWLDSLAGDLVVRALRGWASRRPHTRWIDRVHERLRSHPSSSHSLVELAHEARAHPSHLARSFRERYGVPVVAFQRQRRLEAAARELLTSRPLVWPGCKCSNPVGMAQDRRKRRLFQAGRQFSGKLSGLAATLNKSLAIRASLLWAVCCVGNLRHSWATAVVSARPETVCPSPGTSNPQDCLCPGSVLQLIPNQRARIRRDLVSLAPARLTLRRPR